MFIYMEVEVVIYGPAYFGLSEYRVVRLRIGVHNGATVRDVLRRLEEVYPSVVRTVVRGDSLDDMHDVWLNNRSVRYQQGLDTPVKPGDVVMIIPPFGG